jgi:hypothetical protein
VSYESSVVLDERRARHATGVAQVDDQGEVTAVRRLISERSSAISRLVAGHVI